jgi:hypothetical protein
MIPQSTGSKALALIKESYKRELVLTCRKLYLGLLERIKQEKAE